MRLLGYTILIAALSASAFAGTPAPVPEVDASSFGSALALLSGGILILRGRRKR